MKFTYGWKPGANTKNGENYTPPALFTPLPEEFDLKDKFTQPHQSQLYIPSCVSHAIGSLIYYRTSNIASRLFIYYNSRLLEGTVGKLVGTTIESGIQSLSKWGWCNEDAWKYDPEKHHISPSSELYIEANKNKITQSKTIPRNLDTIKSALFSGDPFCLGFLVFENFEEAESDGLVKVPVNIDSPIGGHAVLAIGYSDIKKSILARNSFGQEWGDSGNIWIPYDYLLNEKLSDDFWTF